MCGEGIKQLFSARVNKAIIMRFSSSWMGGKWRINDDDVWRDLKYGEHIKSAEAFSKQSEEWGM